MRLRLYGVASLDFQPAGRAPARFRAVPLSAAVGNIRFQLRTVAYRKDRFREMYIAAVDFGRSTDLPSRTSDCKLYSVRESERSVLWRYICFCHPEREPLRFLSWRVLPLTIPSGPFLPVNAALLLCASSPRFSVKNLLECAVNRSSRVEVCRRTIESTVSAV